MSPTPTRSSGVSDVRATIVAEARSWIGTPWVHCNRLKGVGVDCAQLLIGVYSTVGLVPKIETGYYPEQWHLHRDEPRFLTFMLPYVDCTTSPQPGDIAMFRYGRHAAHGAIVTELPKVIHAWRDCRMVIESDCEVEGALKQRLVAFYKVKGI